jgi:hypothetical protein
MHSARTAATNRTSVRLLVVGPDIRDIRKVKNFTGQWAFYLMREMRKRGVAVHIVDGKNPDPLKHLASVRGGCDHALALGLRWFTHQPIGCAAVLKQKVRGAVTQLHDGLVHEHLSPFMVGVDCTFTFRDDATRVRDWGRYEKTNCYIGWAADPEYLFPEQSADELRILIDHPYYKSGAPDVTEAVTRDAVQFANSGTWRGRYKSVRVRRLINGGAEDVKITDPMVRTFDREHVPFPVIAREYRQCHVFLPTHKESVGLTALELGYCGALVACSNGLLYPDRLNCVRHVQFDGAHAPWHTILDHINIKDSAEQARLQTWEAVTSRMLEWFENYK